MKLFQLLAISAVFAFSANVFAQAPGQAAKTIKITKITGTVNIMKDGVVVMTLKPGDAIPEITDNKVTFAVVDGTIEIEAGGKKISGATGSNFSVASNAGQVNVALGAGTPVAVKTESGQNVILTANSEVKMINTNGNVNISMEKGNAVMTNASGGETQTVQAGQTVTVPSAPVITPTASTPATPEVKEPVVIVEPPATTVIPTVEVVQAVCDVSSSSPDCN
ncbi:MAG: hypothetical protein PHV36_02250 [Elusimicrobiales bacterium]|nr:hypothetical protein [Elusimicrobiales bacterium]